MGALVDGSFNATESSFPITFLSFTQALPFSRLHSNAFNESVFDGAMACGSQLWEFLPRGVGIFLGVPLSGW
jgi:hypothetical protein